MQTARRFTQLDWMNEVELSEPLTLRKKDVFNLSVTGEVKRAIAGYRALRARDAQHCIVEGGRLISANGSFSTRWVAWYPAQQSLVVEGSDRMLHTYDVDTWVAEGLDQKLEEVELYYELTAAMEAAESTIFKYKDQIWEMQSQNWVSYTHVWFINVTDADVPSVG